MELAGYRILRQLGAGGMGEVFLARSESAAGLGRAVVIKTVTGRLQENREAAARFLDEARLAIQLSHRNICSVTHVGQSDSGFFLVMDYVAGRDLRDVMKALEARGERMAVPLALHVWNEIVDALDYAHRFADPSTGQPMRIVHRDVSPSNVMISLEGEVKLIDFGHALSSLKAERTAAGVVIGKAAYMSPEQARGENVDARSDLYSASVIGAELLVGGGYRAGSTKEEMLQAAAAGRPSPCLLALDAELRELLLQGLAGDPAQRAASAEDLRLGIERALVERRTVVGARDLRALMREIFPGELDRQREILSEALARDADAAGLAALGPGMSDKWKTAPRPQQPQRRAPTATEESGPARHDLTEALPLPTAPHGDVEPPTPATATQLVEPVVPVARRVPWLPAAAALALVVVVAGVGAAIALAGGDAADTRAPAAVPVAAVSDAPAPPTAAPQPPTTAPPVEPGVAPVDEQAAPAASATKEPVKRSRPVSTKPKTRSEILALLGKCKQKCAAPIVDKWSRVGSLSIDETRTLQAETNACVKRCGG